MDDLVRSKALTQPELEVPSPPAGVPLAAKTRARQVVSSESRGSGGKEDSSSPDIRVWMASASFEQIPVKRRCRGLTTDEFDRVNHQPEPRSGRMRGGRREAEGKEGATELVSRRPRLHFERLKGLVGLTKTADTDTGAER